MRILKFVAAGVGVVVVLAAAAAGAIWVAGYRVQLDGSGTPRLALRLPAAQLAESVEAHRQSQRRETPDPVAAAEPLPSASVSPEAAAVSVGEPAPAAPEASRPATPSRRLYWTGFRGPLRDGHYQEGPVRTDWPAAGLTPLWKQPIGGGYASFAVAEGRAFTIEQRRTEEVVAAYDVATGLELWTHAWDGDFKEWMGGDGPRATPTWVDGRLYALGAEGELRALDAETGAQIWRVNILEDNGVSNLTWGMAASPLVFDDLVVVHPGGPGGRSVVAYDRHTGVRRWSALDDKAAYSSPLLATIAGERQILVITAARIAALTPETGALRWSHPWPAPNDINASQPVLAGRDRILLSSGYGTGAALIEVRAAGGGFETREVWKHNRLKNRFSSSLVHEGHVYGLDETILTCLDLETGEVRWKAGRYGHGQLVLASGHLIVLTEDGDLALVRATPDRHDERARFPVLNGKTWNHPVIDDGRLLVRNLAEMAVFDLRVR
ncbi:MAG: PQQ-binding-like beta-propeller repeat protein [Vicinamibacterales bacterium]|nr:PQQ-binding-like beta-propeller repeat protein [Vicinamibacterales bacterium]